MTKDAEAGKKQPAPVTLGIDIGGANVKASDASGRAVAVPFPMWSDASRLGNVVRTLCTEFEAEHRCQITALAVTMTGELADCFATRREGVESILHHVATAFPPERTFVYTVDGEWLGSTVARHDPWRVAASNWHALASWIHHSRIWHRADSDSRMVELQMIVDVGSTTVDIIPINAIGVATPARTDRQRLQLGQLIYTGMERTPIAAIAAAVLVDGTRCPLMAERFATSDDAYVVLGLVSEDESDCSTADGRPRTRACASARLARMVGEDVETLSIENVESIAAQVVEAQAKQVAEGISRNLRPVQCLPSGAAGLSAIMVSGHGRALMEHVRPHLQNSNFRFLWLDESISAAATRCGPALAVAWLWEHRHALTTRS